MRPAAAASPSPSPQRRLRQQRLPFNAQPFSPPRRPEPAPCSPPLRAIPDSQIYYRDRATGLRLCQTVQPQPQPPSPRADPPVLHLGLAPLPQHPLPPRSSSSPSAAAGAAVDSPQLISSALQRLDRLFATTATSLLAPPPPPPPPRAALYRDPPLHSPLAAGGGGEAAGEGLCAAADLPPLPPCSEPLQLAPPGSRLMHLIHDTREQIAQLKAILAASRANSL